MLAAPQKKLHPFNKVPLNADDAANLASWTQVRDKTIFKMEFRVAKVVRWLGKASGVISSIETVCPCIDLLKN